eukprot:9412199-Pyramimonas_sp.AAC.1
MGDSVSCVFTSTTHVGFNTLIGPRARLSPKLWTNRFAAPTFSTNLAPISGTPSAPSLPADAWISWAHSLRGAQASGSEFSEWGRGGSFGHWHPERDAGAGPGRSAKLNPLRAQRT